MAGSRALLVPALVAVAQLGAATAADADPRDLYGRYAIVSDGATVSFAPGRAPRRSAVGPRVDGTISIFARGENTAMSVRGEARFFGGEEGTRFQASYVAGPAGRTGRVVDAWMGLGGRTVGDARFGRVSRTPKVWRIQDARYVFSDSPNQPGESGRVDVAVEVLKRSAGKARVIRLKHLAYRDPDGRTRALTVNVKAVRVE